MGLLHPAIGIPLVALIQFIVFLFCVIASPLGQLLFHRSRQCYTYWGYKEVCSRRRYTSRWRDAFGCNNRVHTMKAAASFSIISIFFTLMTFLLTLTMALRYVAPTILGIFFALISTGVTLVPWACVAAVHNRHMCGQRYGDFTRYGPGFGLQLTAWCLQFINLFLICCVGYYGSRRKCDPCCDPCPQPCPPPCPQPIAYCQRPCSQNIHPVVYAPAVYPQATYQTGQIRY